MRGDVPPGWKLCRSCGLRPAAPGKVCARCRAEGKCHHHWHDLGLNLAECTHCGQVIMHDMSHAEFALQDSEVEAPEDAGPEGPAKPEYVCDFCRRPTSVVFIHGDFWLCYDCRHGIELR